MRKFLSARNALIAAIAATLLFIFGNSALPRVESLLVSDKAADVLYTIARPPLEFVAGKERSEAILEALDVRKLAHFVEFFLLGTLACLCARLSRPMRWQTLWNVFSLCMAAALADETLQMFAMRGAEVKDVLLDIAGAVTGIGIALLFPVRRRKAAKDDKTE